MLFQFSGLSAKKIARPENPVNATAVYECFLEMDRFNVLALSLIRFSRPYARGCVLAAQVLLVTVLICGFAGCQRENAQWTFAAGMNAREDGDPETAIDLLQEALRLSPGSDNIKIQLASLLAESGQGEPGLSLCDEVLAIYPKHDEARKAKITCLKYLGRFDEALVEHQLRDSRKIDKSENVLNGLAYHRALANRELDKALRQIDEAIEKVEGSASITLQTALAVAMISRHVDQQDAAMLVVNNHIAKVAEYWGARNSRIGRLLADKEFSRSTGNEQLTKKIEDQIKETGASLDDLGRGLSRLLAARALLAEDLGDIELADHDRRWVRELGFDFDDSLAALPQDRDCLNVLDVAAAFLDTRGFILTLLPWRTLASGSSSDFDAEGRLNDKTNIIRSDYWSATENLDLAIAAAEVRHAALTNDNLFNHVIEPLERVKKRVRESPHTLAVLLYHRFLAHKKAGKFDLAAADKKRIEELGFPANCRLF